MRASHYMAHFMRKWKRSILIHMYVELILSDHLPMIISLQRPPLDKDPIVITIMYCNTLTFTPVDFPNIFPY